jgi:arylsulfatase
VKEKKPFFLFVPYTMTHYPLLPHPDFDGKTGHGGMADVLAQIDAYNGMLLDAIDELKIRDNTLFIFTADNGPEAVPEGSSTPSVDYFIPGSAGPWRGSLFTGFEGSLRVPFAMRWPGKIPAGTTSDEIVHEMDLYPTFASIVGGKVPDDRVIDGVDQTDFLLGEQEKSNREGVIVYMGNEVWGVKWRNWKVNLKEQDNIVSETRSYGMPRIYNLYKDPGETQNVIFPETWVPKAALGQLGAHAVSLRSNPPIKPGTKDPYEPPK